MKRCREEIIFSQNNYPRYLVKFEYLMLEGRLTTDRVQGKILEIQNFGPNIISKFFWKRFKVNMESLLL